MAAAFRKKVAAEEEMGCEDEGKHVQLQTTNKL